MRFLLSVWSCLCVTLVLPDCLMAADVDVAVKSAADTIKSDQQTVAQNLLKQYPNQVDAWQILANVHRTQGNDTEFLVALKKCAEIAPTRPDIHEQLGHHAAEHEDFTSATEHFRKSLKLRPSPTVMVALGRALYHDGSLTEAAQTLRAVAAARTQQGRAVDPTGDAQYLLGEIAFQSEDYTAATRRFTAALNLQPNHRDALYGMVKVATQLGDEPKATKYLAQFQRVQQFLAEMNQRRRATYDDLRELRQHAAQTMTDVGRIYQRRGQQATAIGLWQRAANLDHSQVACRELLASHFVAIKNPSAAIRRYREMVQLQPKRLSTYERLGILLATQKDFVGAEQVFTAMTKQPVNPSRGYRMLAKLYLNSGRKADQALRLANLALKQDPVADSYFVVGWALSKKQNYVAARKSLQKAITLEPSNRTYQQLMSTLPSE